MKRRFLCALALAAIPMLPVRAESDPVVATSFRAQRGQEDTDEFLGAVGDQPYQYGEVFAFEGRVGDATTAGDHEGGLFLAPPPYPNESRLYNPGWIPLQWRWSDANGEPRHEYFSIQYLPATRENPAKVTLRVGQSSVPRGDDFSYTWDWAANPPPLDASVGSEMYLRDLIVRLSPVNAGTRGTRVTVENLVLTSQGQEPRPLVAPDTKRSFLTANASVEAPHPERSWFYFSDVFSAVRPFEVSGRARIEWSPELMPGTAPLQGSQLGFELKFGCFLPRQKVLAASAAYVPLTPFVGMVSWGQHVRQDGAVVSETNNIPVLHVPPAKGPTNTVDGAPQPVPEPGTIAAGLAVVAGIGWQMLRRRRA
jgi:hypothetical protein